MLWLSRLGRIDPTGRVNASLWRKVSLARRVTLTTPKRVTSLLAESTLVSHINGSPHFARRCMKSQLAQGNLGQPGHLTWPFSSGQLFSINGALVIIFLASRSCIFTIIIILSTEQGFSVKRMPELFFNRKVKSKTEKLTTTKRRWKKYMCNKAATTSLI